MQTGIFPPPGVGGLGAQTFGYVGVEFGPDVGAYFLPAATVVFGCRDSSLVAVAEFIPERMAGFQAMGPGHVVEPEQKFFRAGGNVVELRAQGFGILLYGIAS